jgi:large subunit ribosomal protein L22
MPGVKTNERPGTRAVLRYHRLSAPKARAVLDLVRGADVERAQEILATCERGPAEAIGKVLASAVANAVHNDSMDPEDLYVSACYADEGPTLKRWRPRARGRATRIRKRTCHITLIVSRLPEDRLQRRRAERASSGVQRSRRVAESRRRADLAGRLGRRRAAAQEREAAEREAAEREAEEAEALETEEDEDGVEAGGSVDAEQAELDEGQEPEEEVDDEMTTEESSEKDERGRR